MSTPRATEILADYEGLTEANPDKGNQKDFYMEAIGRAFPNKGSAGVPTSDNGKTGLRIALKPNSSDVQSYSLSGLNAGLAVNVNAGSYTGFSSWLSKMYIQDVGDTPQRHLIGEKFTLGAQYLVELYPNSEDVGSL